MAKADLGTKRACLACGMRFYISNEVHICPGCGAEFDTENIIKSRKGRPTAKQTSRNDGNATDDNPTQNDGDAEALTDAVIDDNDDDEVGFDDDVDDDGPGIIQDDISDDDELLPNLDEKDEN